MGANSVSPNPPGQRRLLPSFTAAIKTVRCRRLELFEGVRNGATATQCPHDAGRSRPLPAVQHGIHPFGPVAERGVASGSRAGSPQGEILFLGLYLNGAHE